MLKLAVAGNSDYFVSDIEAKRAAPSYSIDTIGILLSQIGDSGDLYFIIGADAFFEIDTWKQYKELPAMVNFVIISRPGYPPDKVGEVIRQNFPDYIHDPALGIWRSPASGKSFLIQHMKPVAISSTEIRHRLRIGLDITGLVPEAVEEYIDKHGLYRK